jgi:hypothetical protein
MAEQLDAESPEDHAVAAVGEPAVDLIHRIEDLVDALYSADPQLSLALSVEDWA